MITFWDEISGSLVRAKKRVACQMTGKHPHIPGYTVRQLHVSITVVKVWWRKMKSAEGFLFLQKLCILQNSYISSSFFSFLIASFPALLTSAKKGESFLGFI